MEYNYTPIAVFTYNRPEHTKRILEALNGSDIAPYSEMFIFCDNYKTELSKENVQKVRGIVDIFAQECRFKRVTIKKADSNKGLATSIIEGVSEILNIYERVIVVEDDLLASKHFLEYMNSALDYYDKNEAVWSISGYSFPMRSLSNYPHDIFMSGRGSSWGWATWRDRWATVDWDVKDYPSFRSDQKRRRQFARWGSDLPLMLDAQMSSNHNSWAIRWCYSQFIQKKMTVYPKTSYIKNIGNDGSGTHKSRLGKKYDTELENYKFFRCTFENLTYDEKIRRDFRKKYSPNIWGRMKSIVKRFMLKIGII